jgi:DNA-binding NarL/FixJ family response regulator
MLLARECCQSSLPGDVSESAARLLPLSPRERQLVALVAHGLTNKEIAFRLQISLHTTKEYMSRILQKTGLTSRAAVAATYATDWGLLGESRLWLTEAEGN